MRAVRKREFWWQVLNDTHDHSLHPSGISAVGPAYDTSFPILIEHRMRKSAVGIRSSFLVFPDVVLGGRVHKKLVAFSFHSTLVSFGNAGQWYWISLRSCLRFRIG
jgi:hypothetical protein